MIRDRIRVPHLAAGSGIEGVESTIDRGHVDAALPHGDAAIDHVATRIARRAHIRLRIEAPQLPAAGGIHGIHVPPGARGVHDTVHHNRCGFLAARRGQIILPRKAQPIDVARVDALKR